MNKNFPFNPDTLFEDTLDGRPVEIYCDKIENTDLSYNLTIIKRKYPFSEIDVMLQTKVTLEAKNDNIPTEITQSIGKLNLIDHLPMPILITVPEHIQDNKLVSAIQICVDRRVIPFFVEQPHTKYPKRKNKFTIKRTSRKRRQGHSRNK